MMLPPTSQQAASLFDMLLSMWGHPHCNSPSSVQFSAAKHQDNTLSLLSFFLGNPSPLTAPNQVQLPITAP